MAYQQVESIVDQYLTQDMASLQLSRSLVSIGYYVNVQSRSTIAHSHPYYEFILVRRGVAEYLANGERFFLHPDEMLMIAPGTVHTMLCAQEAPSYERLILQVDGAFMAQILASCGGIEWTGRKLPLNRLRAEAVCSAMLRTPEPPA